MMRRFLTINCYISISGVVTFKNAKAIKEVAKEVPLDRLLVETDDPYLTPVPFRGKENRPSYVKYVLKEIAEIKEMNYEELEKIVYENSLRVFHL
jgi:TatD DNase family protein